MHNTKDPQDHGRALEKFPPDIITRLRQMVEEFCTALDCVDVGFIPDGLLDALPAACQLGATRVGGIDVNKPRMPGRTGRCPGAGHRPRRLHRRRLHRQGPRHDRAGRVHPPQRRLRSPQAEMNKQLAADLEKIITALQVSDASRRQAADAC